MFQAWVAAAKILISQRGSGTQEHIWKDKFNMSVLCTVVLCSGTNSQKSPWKAERQLLGINDVNKRNRGLNIYMHRAKSQYYATGDQVYLLSPKERKTPQIWNSIFALSQGPLQTPTWALWSQQKLAMLFAQQQRPLQCSRLMSLSDHTLQCEAPLLGKRGTGCLVSMSPQSKGLTTATTTLQRIIKSKTILRKKKKETLLRSNMFTLQPCTQEELGMAWIFLCTPFHFLLGKNLTPCGWSVQLQIFGIRTTVCLCAYECERAHMLECVYLMELTAPKMKHKV